MSQSFASVKVWHILLAFGLVVVGVVAYNIFTYDNIVESGTGEKFLKKSFGKPLPAAKAKAAADKAVAEKKN